MLQNFCRWILYKKLGWKKDITVDLPEKYIICLAPHTSNWDLFLGQAFAKAEGMKSNFLMKKEWFFWPLGPIFRKMGGIPVWRSKHTSMTDNPRFTDIPQLNIYGNSFVMETLRKSLDDMEELKINLHEIREGKEEKTDGYRILPVRGNHGSQRGFSHSYIIQKDGKTLLYALDSGSYDEDQFALIQEYQYDAVIMEGTTGLNEQYGGHMCLMNNIRIRDRLKENKCLRENSRFLLTHLSPHWCPPHDWYESIVASEGLELAYDGLQIEI